jgi:hypothetical protein
MRKNNAAFFWPPIFGLWMIFSSFDHHYLLNFQQQTPSFIEQKILLVRLYYGQRGAKNGLRKRKKFDIVYHSRLEKKFQDW